MLDAKFIFHRWQPVFDVISWKRVSEQAHSLTLAAYDVNTINSKRSTNAFLWHCFLLLIVYLFLSAAVQLFVVHHCCFYYFHGTHLYLHHSAILLDCQVGTFTGRRLCILCFCFILHSCCIIVSAVVWTWWDWISFHCFDTVSWVIDP